MPSSALFMADFLPLQLNMRSIVQSGTKSQLNSFESEVGKGATDGIVIIHPKIGVLNLQGY